jgi:signal transduction histidine kinase
MAHTAPSRWLREHRAAADALLAVGLFVVGVIGVRVNRNASDQFSDVDILAFVLIASMTIPLAWRRARPVEIFTISIISLFAFEIRRYPDSPATIATIVALYSVAAHLRDRKKATITGVVSFTIISGFLMVGIARHEEGSTFWNYIGNTLIFGTAWVLGDNLYRRRERLADLEQRAQDLERSSDLETSAAVAAERSRIARELHDVVAHSLSVMVVQAGAARRVLAQDPDATVRALEQIEATGRESLTEMRRLLGVLRTDESAQRQPQPTIQHIRDLVAMEPELDVEVTVRGTERLVPAAVDLSAYRIVQEALTNARKHAHADRVEIRIEWSEDTVAVIVADDGRGASTLLRHQGNDTPGHGIMGMQERAAIVGGSLVARPRPGGGWQVHAVLPTTTRTSVEP